MSRRSLTIAQVLAILTETPARIAAATVGVPAARLRASPAPDEWSANEVLTHLRCCADVWGDCMLRILDEDRPTIQAVNPRTRIATCGYSDLAFRTSLGAFTAQRADLLARLAPVPPSTWARTANVTGAGKPLQLTVLTYAQRMSVHERPHVKQIAAATTG